MTSPALLDPAADPLALDDPAYLQPADDNGDSELTPDQRRALLVLTALLATGTPLPALTAKAVQLLPGLPAAAVIAAVRLAAARPAHGVPRDVAVRTAVAPDRAAYADAIAGEPAMRARYLLAAAQRLAGSVLSPDPASAFTQALDAERRYRTAHEAAQVRRLNAASNVDSAAERYGERLGWYAVIDNRTTPDCVALDGTDFYASQEPPGGWPGARHGSTCRCTAGPPHNATAALDPLAA